jgi:hypothetical protein
MGFASLDPSYAVSGDAGEVAQQTAHVDQAGREQGNAKDFVHRCLQESPAKHGRDSGPESQSLFFAGFISRLRNRVRFWRRSITAGSRRDRSRTIVEHRRSPQEARLDCNVYVIKLRLNAPVALVIVFAGASVAF